MSLFRLPLDATGHVQDANVFMTLFPDFPSDFFLCILLLQIQKHRLLIYLPFTAICVRNPKKFRALVTCITVHVYCQMLDGAWIFKQSKSYSSRRLTPKMLHNILQQRRTDDMDYIALFGKLYFMKFSRDTTCNRVSLKLHKQQDIGSE